MEHQHFSMLVINGEFGKSILSLGGDSDLSRIKQHIQKIGHEAWLQEIANLDEMQIGGFQFEVVAKFDDSGVSYRLIHTHQFIKGMTREEIAESKGNSNVVQLRH